MAKKKAPPREAGSDVEDVGSRKSLSKEAWVAIGTIAAALITGMVTLLIHFLPPGQNSSPSSSPPPSPVQSVTTADAIAGTWAGPAKDSYGTAFQISLVVSKSCTFNQRCGTISVSHVPCYGEIFLEKAQGSEFEFRVANFSGKSNRAVCQPGAGEQFKLRPDGRLAYSTTYEPKATGLLERKGD